VVEVVVLAAGGGFSGEELAVAVEVVFGNGPAGGVLAVFMEDFAVEVTDGPLGDAGADFFIQMRSSSAPLEDDRVGLPDIVTEIKNCAPYNIVARPWLQTEDILPFCRIVDL
jgi:hypothetical protein